MTAGRDVASTEAGLVQRQLKSAPGKQGLEGKSPAEGAPQSSVLVGAPPASTQGVRFGRAKLVHIRSAFRWNETACSIGGVQAPDLTPTTDPVTCEACILAASIRRAR